MSRVALGLRAIRGGAVTVGVVLEGQAPRVLLSTFLATAAEGDRLAFEPYHVAYETAQGQGGFAAAEAAVAEGRRRQRAQAAANLADILQRLRQAGGEPAVAALLVNRAGWVSDLLRYSLMMPDHPPVAEGLAVRDALRAAAGASGLELTEMDEKSLPDTAGAVLDLSPSGLEAKLKDLGAAAGRPWRKEQKLACLAAWLALVQA